MRLDNPSDELSTGRLFIHARLNDPMTGGPLYCRIRAFDGYSQTELDSDAARQD
jgi:hypothetical protein